MSNFEFALIGVGISALLILAFTMGISHWQDRKRHAH